MKIVHVQMSVTNSGNAPYRLHKFLLESGIESKMIVQQKKIIDDKISLYKENNLEKFLWSNCRIYFENIYSKYVLKILKKTNFSSWKIGVSLSNHTWIKEADIIHLHWINGGFVSLNEIKKLLKLNKKIIWTFHDSSPFTGGCHVRENCMKYIIGCKNCPLVENKLSKKIIESIMHKKNKIFNKYNSLKIILPSNWMLESVNKSELLKNNEKVVIANVLDNKIFKPLNKNFCKEVLNLNPNKKYILFGATSIKDENKGYYELKMALEILKRNIKFEEIEILIFGRSSIKEVLAFKHIELGEINSEELLSIIYNCSDVFVGPSYEESFGQVFNESIFCGVPAVAFKGSGSMDIIDHLKNGYLANLGDVEDLAFGIKFCLENKNKILSNRKMDSKYILEKMKKVYNID